MNPIRHFVEVISRGKVFCRRFPSRYGSAQLYVTPECGLRYLRLSLESVDVNLLNSAFEFVKPGAVIWDVGANLGLFSFAAAGLAGPTGKVFAIEPDTYLVGLLRRSARLNQNENRIAPVTVIPCAVAESLALETFHIAKRARASNFLSGHGGSQTGGARENQHVLAITLDWLATQIPIPNLIKIDVEGADLRVLRGASQLLRAEKPDLIFEASGATATEAATFLSELGYTLFDADLPFQSRQPLSRPTYNTLAVSTPKSSVPLWPR
jgi:FkbM family methyltransferase